VACSRIKPSITFPLPQEQYKSKQLKQASDTELLMGIDTHEASSSIHKINTELFCYAVNLFFLLNWDQTQSRTFSNKESDTSPEFARILNEQRFDDQCHQSNQVPSISTLLQTPLKRLRTCLGYRGSNTRRCWSS
jgi:hypothetical protein